MQWLRGARGKQGHADYIEAPREELPAVFQTTDPPLRVWVYHHRIRYPPEPTDCWTYVTHGLWTWGQREIVLTLRCLPDEMSGDTFRIPKAPLRVLHDICALALRGRRVDMGSYSEFNAPDRMIGDFKGMFYVLPQYMSGVTLPSTGALAAILVHEEELAIIRRGGPTRIAARLGLKYLYFPVPPWSDRRRAPLANLAPMLEHSYFLNVVQIQVQGSAFIQDNGVTLLLSQRNMGVERVFDQWTPDIPFSFSLQVDPQADACMVWKPPDMQVGAIVRDSLPFARLSACFLGFEPRQGEQHAIVRGEDGLLVQVDGAILSALVEALCKKEPFSIDGLANTAHFRVEWRERPLVEAYPFTAVIQPKPETLNRDQATRGPTSVSLPVIAMYSTNDDVWLHVGSDPLEQFLQAIDHQICDTFAPLPAGSDADFALHMILQPEGHFWRDRVLRVREGVSESPFSLPMRGLISRLGRVKGPALKRNQPIGIVYLVVLGEGSGKPLLGIA